MHHMLPQKTGQGPKARLPAAAPASAEEPAPTAAGKAGASAQAGWCSWEPHLGTLSARLVPWAAPGCYGRERRALCRRLSCAVLHQQQRAKLGD